MFYVPVKRMKRLNDIAIHTSIKLRQIVYYTDKWQKSLIQQTFHAVNKKYTSQNSRTCLLSHAFYRLSVQSDICIRLLKFELTHVLKYFFRIILLSFFYSMHSNAVKRGKFALQKVFALNFDFLNFSKYIIIIIIK